MKILYIILGTVVFLEIVNILLGKIYRRGYRQGWFEHEQTNLDPPSYNDIKYRGAKWSGIFSLIPSLGLASGRSPRFLWSHYLCV